MVPCQSLTIMKKVFLTLIIFLCFVLQSFSQSKISGVLKNTEGGSVDFVSVIASPANAPKTILASTFTDDNGMFRMSVNSECDSIILKASSI